MNMYNEKWSINEEFLIFKSVVDFNLSKTIPNSRARGSVINEIAYNLSTQPEFKNRSVNAICEHIRYMLRSFCRCNK
ncbi:MAG: hypothetical protein CVU87_08170 [Firmicutes bacterium HGW-Firmicutes-12]|nr:MAG: hypothetical protein CVU87_08170 [Firmicutes bacterium HGW-Firmicutes-12]